MKKSLLAVALMVSSVAFAATVPVAVPAPASPPVSFATYPRVLTFSSANNSISNDGQLLVCLPQFKTSQENWNAPVLCSDANGHNAWSLAENALPGFKLTAYEIRYLGAGSRYLILYFGAK